MQLKRKERESRISGGFFKNFGEEIPPRQDQTDRNNEANRDTESTTSSNQDEAVATHEPRVYPGIPEKNYRDGPIKVIAVHYIRKNRVVEQKATRNTQQEDNVRAAELDFMLDLETLIKETAADVDFIELNCCIEDNKFLQPKKLKMNHRKRHAKKSKLISQATSIAKNYNLART